MINSERAIKKTEKARKRKDRVQFLKESFFFIKNYFRVNFRIRESISKGFTDCSFYYELSETKYVDFVDWIIPILEKKNYSIDTEGLGNPFDNTRVMIISWEK